MNITETLEKEFSKDKLSKVNIHLLIKTYLEEEVKNNVTTENFNYFLRKSEFLSFFKEENFKKRFHNLDIYSTIRSNESFDFHIESETESILFDHIKNNKYNQLGIVYEKEIGGIFIRKRLLLEREPNNNIKTFFVKVSVNDSTTSMNFAVDDKVVNCYLNYGFIFNIKEKKLDLNDCPDFMPEESKKDFVEELSKRTQINNYMEQSFFDIEELKCDYDHEIKKILLDFFNAENFDNVGYFKETHDLLDFCLRKFEK